MSRINETKRERKRERGGGVFFVFDGTFPSIFFSVAFTEFIQRSTRITYRYLPMGKWLYRFVSRDTTHRVRLIRPSRENKGESERERKREKQRRGAYFGDCRSCAIGASFAIEARNDHQLRVLINRH